MAAILRHRTLMDRIMLWPRSSPSSPLDATLFFLVLVVAALTIGEDDVIADRQKVERAQEKYLTLLHR